MTTGDVVFREGMAVRTADGDDGIVSFVRDLHGVPHCWVVVEQFRSATPLPCSTLTPLVPDTEPSAQVTLEQDLADLLNRRSDESRSDTHDIVLAGFLCDCLDAFHKATRHRSRLRAQGERE